MTTHTDNGQAVAHPAGFALDAGQLDLLPGAVYFCNREGVLLHWNRCAVELWGREPKPGDRAERFCGSYKLYRPDGTFMVHADCPVADALRTGLPQRNIEAVIERPDGTRRLVLANIDAVRDRSGAVIGAVNILHDVTDHRWVEEVRRANHTLQTLVDSCPLAVVVIDPNPPVVRLWNPAAERLFGWLETEVVGRPIPIVPDEGLDDCQSVREVVQQGESYFGVETYRRRKDGSLIHVSVSAAPLRDAQGSVSGILLLLADDTERRRSEEALRASEARLHAILDNTTACVFAKDLDGRYIIANRSFIALFSWHGPDAVLGRTDYELHPREEADAYVANDRLVLEAGQPLEFEETAALPDGMRTYLMLKFPLRDHVGAVYGVCGIATDITERKRLLTLERAARADAEAAHRRYRELVDGLDAIVWEADARTWEFTFVSQRVEHILGYPANRWLNDPGFWPDLIHPDDRESAITFCKEACAACRDHDFTYRAVAADGRTVWLRDIVYVVKGDDGRASHLRGIMIDVTETKRLQAELERRAAQLAEADQRKDEFLATLAHELRNPLAPIRNAMHVMQQSVDAAAIRRVRDMADRQVGHMARLLDDLLDVSRISRGKIELRREVLDVTAVVNRSVEAMRPLFTERGHELIISLPPEPLWVDADPTRLEQVLTNLLTNACKYTDPGGRIWLTAEGTGGEAVLRVRDTGIGIAPGMLEKVFDLFVQAERRLDRSQGGIGIGLTLVRRLVELHGGTVEARSPGPGRGSEFVIRLPAVGAEPAADERACRGLVESAPAAVPCRRVLVVDDNVDAADSMALLLQLAGHEVRVSHDGSTALLLAQTFRPQVVLLDIGMPGMDGYEVARRLRRRPENASAVLVALTGWGQDHDRQRSLEAGFDHHLVKPAEIGALISILAGLPPGRT